MSSTASLSFDEAKVKLTEVELELKRLQEVRDHLKYIVSNPDFFFSFPAQRQLSLSFSESVHVSNSLGSKIAYNPVLSTKDLILAILQNESRGMRAKEIFEIFARIKPDISKNGFTTRLSKISRDDKTPVMREGELYSYTEKR